MQKREFSSQEIKDILQKLDIYLSDLKARWDQENEETKSWWRIQRGVLVKVTLFLLNILDELIQFVETLLPEGEDKKAAVVVLVTKLFDYIVATAFPFWLKPFVPVIKKIVIGVVINTLIDFMVAKYNAGFWKTENNGETAPQTT